MNNFLFFLVLLLFFFCVGCTHSNLTTDDSHTIQVQDFILTETGIDINDSITKKYGPYLFTGPRIEKLGAQLYFLGPYCYYYYD